IRSVGMLISRAFCIARRRRKFPSGLPPPSRAAMVISRLARVNACPRLASTTAFLCLIPAHLEWPDIYARLPAVLWKKTPGVPAKSKISWGGNMLSMILSHANPNETSFTGLQNVAVLDHGVERGLLAVDANPILFDQSPRVAAAAGETGLDERADQVTRVGDHTLSDVVGDLALAELRVEV